MQKKQKIIAIVVAVIIVIGLYCGLMYMNILPNPFLDRSVSGTLVRQKKQFINNSENPDISSEKMQQLKNDFNPDSQQLTPAEIADVESAKKSFKP